MGFGDDLKRFQQTVVTRQQEVFVGVVDLAHESIQTGSALTGAPGQPVDTGRLRDSWQKSFDGPDSATISTNVEYARYIEDGGNSRGEFTQRSAVGGFHSVKLTIAGFQNIVDTMTRRVRGGS